MVAIIIITLHQFDGLMGLTIIITITNPLEQTCCVLAPASTVTPVRHEAPLRWVVVLCAGVESVTFFLNLSQFSEADREDMLTQMIAAVYNALLTYVYCSTQCVTLLRYLCTTSSQWRSYMSLMVEGGTGFRNIYSVQVWKHRCFEEHVLLKIKLKIKN